MVIATWAMLRIGSYRHVGRNEEYGGVSGYKVVFIPSTLEICYKGPNSSSVEFPFNWHTGGITMSNNGVIYAVAENGDLQWFRHEGLDDGSFKWTDTNPRKVGQGFTAPHVFSGGDGIIYVVADNGDLQWFRHEGRFDGMFEWTDTNPRKVGSGFNVPHVLSGGDGIIYAVAENGDLQWFRHEGRDDGSFEWTDTNPRKVGSGFNVPHVFAG
jgi:hypothetical protein